MRELRQYIISIKSLTINNIQLQALLNETALYE